MQKHDFDLKCYVGIEKIIALKDLVFKYNATVKPFLLQGMYRPGLFTKTQNLSR